jgi:hypothetical protein
MKENVAGAERALRATIGPALIAWAGWCSPRPGTRADRLRSC